MDLETARRIDDLARDVERLKRAKGPASLVDAKGDLLVATADDTLARKPVGTDGYRLTAWSPFDDGLAWGAPYGVSAWVPVERQSAKAPGLGVSHYRMHGGGILGMSTDEYVGDTAKNAYYVNPADYAAPVGRTLQWRVRAYLACNGTGATGVTWQTGVWGTASFGGGAGTVVHNPDGTGYFGSAAWVGTIFASSGHAISSSPFAISAPVNFFFGLTLHTAMPANCTVLVNTVLEYRHA